MAAAGTAIFDVIGTLFSLDPIRGAFVQLGAPELAQKQWLAESLRDYFALSHAKAYQPLKRVLASTLPRTLQSYGLDPDDPGRVMDALSKLPPAEGAEEAVRRFRDAKWRVIALTNGSEADARQLLKRAGLGDAFSAVLSCDTVERSKPSPEPYALAAKQAEGPAWMIAAHAWDVMGAKQAGLKAAWVSSIEPLYLDAYPQPDVEAPNLDAAASEILRTLVA